MEGALVGVTDGGVVLIIESVEMVVVEMVVVLLVVEMVVES